MQKGVIIAIVISLIVLVVAVTIYFVTRKTVRTKLSELCPKDPQAGDKINRGNAATYDDYLFSACKKANTCDSYEPDPITEKLLRKTEHCGAWHLDSVGLWWDAPNKKWSTSVLRY